MVYYSLFLIPEIAISPNSAEVHIYKKSLNEWVLMDILKQHDLRITGIDWGVKTNRIVTCAAVSSIFSAYSSYSRLQRPNMFIREA